MVGAVELGAAFLIFLSLDLLNAFWPADKSAAWEDIAMQWTLRLVWIIALTAIALDYFVFGQTPL